MFFRFLLCAFLAVQIVQGKTEEEIREWFVRQGMECNKDHPVTPEELQMIQKNKLPDTANGKCLLACVFKKANYIDSKGMVDEESAIAEAKKIYQDNTEKIENFKKLITICGKDKTLVRPSPDYGLVVKKDYMYKNIYNKSYISVNSETVGDGEAGCDRAALLLKCITEQAPQLGFKIHV